jgi:SAM-dependent methyltransferase
MSSLTDSSAIFHYHRAMLKAYGAQSSYALGWRDTESQLIRFKQLAAIADLNGHSVLDAGCGYADLLPYLLDIYPQLSHYYGMEQIPELLDEAMKRYGNIPGTSFISGNFTTRNLPVMDYVLASGSLNYDSSDPQFIFKAIARLYHNCNKGLAFNLLQHVPINGLLVAYNPQEILTYCSQIGKEVSLKQGYAEEDFTIWMYH